MEDTELLELLDNYHKGVLNQTEMDAFETRFEEDADFREAFILYQLTTESIIAHKKESLRQYLKENTTQKGLLRNIWGVKWSVVSAAILFLFGLLYFVVERINKQEIQQDLADKTSLNADSIATEKKTLSKAIEPKNTNNTQSDSESPNIDTLTTVNEQLALITEEPEITEKFISVQESVAEKRQVVEEDLFPIVYDDAIQDSLIFPFLLQRPNKNDTSQAKNIKNSANDWIRLEIRKSPIDFKGYKYDGKTLVLYGLKLEQLKVFRLLIDPDLLVWQTYISERNKVYAINETHQYERLVEEKNPDVIKTILQY
jgi:hypothetical protein